MVEHSCGIEEDLERKNPEHRRSKAHHHRQFDAHRVGRRNDFAQPTVFLYLEQYRRTRRSSQEPLTNLFSTLKTPNVERAIVSAFRFSTFDRTTPMSVTCPRSTMI